MRPLNIRLPDKDYLKLEEIAADTGQSLSDVGREAIARYLGRAGAGTRMRSRLDKLEAQVAKLNDIFGGVSRGE